MKLVASPSSGLTGRASLPGDKSLSHRAALLASLAEGRSCIRNFLGAGVTDVMLRSLAGLGVAWSAQDGALEIEGRGLHGYRPPKQALDCGNSATTMRLLAGALAASGVPATLDGTPGLRSRPMRRLTEPLQAMGVPIAPSDTGGAPLILAARPAGQPLKGLDYRLPVASAQVKSALLLAALAAEGETVLREPGPSRDHTERMLAGMGLDVRSSRSGTDYVTRLVPSGRLKPLDFTVPGDLSSAAFLLVAALVVPGSQVTVQGVGLNPTRTGLLEALAAMGADLQVVETGQECGEPVGEVTACSSSLHGTQVGGDLVVRMIDEFPIFAVAAACAAGQTVVRDAGELRFKESDRIAALCTELRRIGVEAAETPDGFVIRGGRQPVGGEVDPHGDHRLAMSLAVAGLAAEKPVAVCGAEAVDESFPGFTQLLESFGARLAQAEAA